jgi:RES domain-containing protein
MDREIKELLSLLLKKLPVRRLRHTLARCVELESLIENGEPDFLFTSGKRDRYNLDDVECIYFAENEETARAEHRCQDHPARSLQPVCMFFAEVSLPIVDLTQNSVRETLGLTKKDFHVPWERTGKPTKSQLLGTAVSRQRCFAAIRYPSDAARVHRFPGHNLVIFRDCVRRPNFVRVLGPGKKRLQSWP